MFYITISLAAAVWVALTFLTRKWRAWRVRQWVKGQLAIASFGYVVDTSTETYLRLRATENRRLRAAFGINNSLTTASRVEHQAFMTTAHLLVKNKRRNWETLYGVAERFLQVELQTVAPRHLDLRSLRLAESVRCMVLAVVLFDNFGIDPATIPRDALVTITEEINNQWLSSKCQPDDVTPSELLNSTIDSLHLTSPSSPIGHQPLAPTEVLSLLMPQYETLWRVVLLTFVTAYHYQADAYQDAEQRTAEVPSCLGTGDPASEKEALQLAKEGLRLCPSNKHLYRSPLPTPGQPNPAPLAADISSLHRHPSIWGRDAYLFRPSRFDSDDFTPAQREAYIPFSVGRHKCPAAGGFGERMVTLLVVALGRGLGPRVGSIQRGKKGLPTGRDEMEGWMFRF
ncbi:hypothetical protein C8A03DRAFT_19513 [Achaetomium macrosporum]|uniref:Cytochrome P450 n=1 Tax=Achaetomium macrosporum TaxID=79813 RepID=A0AAN7C252_9PEZI|nr:hypothetical protein C8A03DRAFT_19513 [Achaetomium macrosporum]